MTACEHQPKSGLVTSRPLDGIEGQYATAPVCGLLECIEEARRWVERVSHRKAYYVAGEVTS